MCCVSVCLFKKARDAGFADGGTLFLLTKKMKIYNNAMKNFLGSCGQSASSVSFVLID